MTGGVVGFAAAGRRLWPAGPGGGVERSSGMGARARGGESRLESCCVTLRLRLRGRLRRKLGRIDCRGCGEDSARWGMGSIVIINEKNKEIKNQGSPGFSVKVVALLDVRGRLVGGLVLANSPRVCPSCSLTRLLLSSTATLHPTETPSLAQSPQLDRRRRDRYT